jgi:hypothetical protein
MAYRGTYWWGVTDWLKAATAAAAFVHMPPGPAYTGGNGVLLLILETIEVDG